MDGVTDVSTLEGRALDLEVAKIEADSDCVVGIWGPPEYSKYWTLGGPIVEREQISLWPRRPDGNFHGWAAEMVYTDAGSWRIATADGRTPLEAAMRAFVAAKQRTQIGPTDG